MKLKQIIITRELDIYGTYVINIEVKFYTAKRNIIRHTFHYFHTTGNLKNKQLIDPEYCRRFANTCWLYLVGRYVLKEKPNYNRKLVSKYFKFLHSKKNFFIKQARRKSCSKRFK